MLAAVSGDQLTQRAGSGEGKELAEELEQLKAKPMETQRQEDAQNVQTYAPLNAPLSGTV